MKTTQRFRESPRLPAFDYTGTHVYNLNTVTRGRRPLLAKPDAASVCLRALNQACAKFSFKCLAYCFMPDHIHLLVASDGGASAERFMRLFKRISGWHFKNRMGEHLWQISYYDHVLRVEDAIEPIALYIWNNPVRAGLVDSHIDYPYNGPAELMRT